MERLIILLMIQQNILMISMISKTYLQNDIL